MNYPTNFNSALVFLFICYLLLTALFLPSLTYAKKDKCKDISETQKICMNELQKDK